MHGDLWEAVRAGLVFRSEGSYRFLHDRVQEAAYSLIPEDVARRGASANRPAARGAHSAGGAGGGDLRDRQSAQPRRRLDHAQRDERERVAELNLIAGKRAKASTAYASALDVSRRRPRTVDGGQLGAPARAHLRARVAPGRMRVPDRRVWRRRRSASSMLSRRAGNARRHRRRRVLAADAVHDPGSERPRRRGMSRLPPTSRHRLVAASDRGGSTARIRADLVAAREPLDRGARSTCP